LDKDGDGKLRFGEFSDLFNPSDRIYREQLERKRPNYDVRYPEDAFTYSTKLDFTDLFRRSMRNEGEIEDRRQALTRRPPFSYNAAFQALDEYDMSRISKEDFSKLLERNHAYMTNRDLDLLMDRFDRDRDGRVTYSEFFNEMAP
jgi:hypothetical protein